MKWLCAKTFSESNFQWTFSKMNFRSTFRFSFLTLEFMLLITYTVKLPFLLSCHLINWSVGKRNETSVLNQKWIISNHVNIVEIKNRRPHENYALDNPILFESQSSRVESRNFFNRANTKTAHDQTYEHSGTSFFYRSAQFYTSIAQHNINKAMLCEYNGCAVYILYNLYTYTAYVVVTENVWPRIESHKEPECK